MEQVWILQHVKLGLVSKRDKMLIKHEDMSIWIECGCDALEKHADGIMFCITH